jgi:hypothetical protein
VIRRQALDGLDHWFDDELVMAEEMDLFLRIAYRWELNFVDRPLAKWRMHDASESSKRGYLVPKEKEIIIDKLIRMCPDIEIKYSAEIKEQRKMIAYEWALSAWKDGDKRRMRRCLKPQLFSDGKSAIAYALSMLPYATYKRIKDSYHSLKFDSYRISKK